MFGWEDSSIGCPPSRGSIPENFGDTNLAYDDYYVYAITFTTLIIDLKRQSQQMQLFYPKFLVESY